MTATLGLAKPLDKNFAPHPVKLKTLFSSQCLHLRHSIDYLAVYFVFSQFQSDAA